MLNTQEFLFVPEYWNNISHCIMSMCYRYATLLWRLQIPCEVFGFCVIFFFSRCDDCGPINMASILTRPFIWLVAPLVLSFILSICCTAEHGSVTQIRLMLKVCRLLMWWFSGGNFNLGTAGDWRGGRQANVFQAAFIKEQRSVQKPFRIWFSKNASTGNVYAVLSVKICLSVHVNGNAWRFYLDTALGSLWRWFWRGLWGQWDKSKAKRKILGSFCDFSLQVFFILATVSSHSFFFFFFFVTG